MKKDYSIVKRINTSFEKKCLRDGFVRNRSVNALLSLFGEDKIDPFMFQDEYERVGDEIVKKAKLNLPQYKGLDNTDDR